jgi:hypothetical protein
MSAWWRYKPVKLWFPEDGNEPVLWRTWKWNIPELVCWSCVLCAGVFECRSFERACILEKCSRCLWVDRGFCHFTSVYTTVVDITISHRPFCAIVCWTVFFCMAVPLLTPSAVMFHHRCLQMFCRIRYCHIILTCHFQYYLTHCFHVV